MKIWIVGLGLIVLPALGANAGLFQDFLPGTYTDKRPPVQSPDGHREARLTYTEQRGFALPPEPAETKSRSTRLQVFKDGKRYYDSGDEPLHVYQNDPGFALDLAWSPDSSRLACRHITSLRIIGDDGQVLARFTPSGKSVVSSFRWIDNANLLVVAKETGMPLDMREEPQWFQGYIEQAKKIHVFRWNLAAGPPADLFQQDLRDPPFIFHAVEFGVEEISPRADRVAFSDGADLCVYDVAANAVIARHTIPQKPKTPVIDPGADELTQQVARKMAAMPDQLDGIWWPSNDKLLVAVALLSGPQNRAFYTLGIPAQEWTDQTASLLPVWENFYRSSPEYAGLDWFGWKDTNWYRSALP